MEDPTLPTKRRFFSRALVALAVLFIFLAGFTSGSWYRNSQADLDLSQFWNVYGLLQKKYVGQIDSKKAVDGAIEGLVNSLGDPYSMYLPPEEKKKLDEELSGEFEGVGAVLAAKDKETVVVELISASPAEKAGIKEKDVIIAVDDQSTDSLVLDEVVAKIRGPKGSSVKITVTRTGTTEPISLTITRDKIQVKSVSSKMIGTVGYIDITQFGDDTVTGVTEAVTDLKAKKAKAVILDLRDNPGGYLNAVPPIAGLFIPPSVIVKEKYRDGKTDSLRSTSLPLLPDTPLFVLTNEFSASAAEILAGALQDYDRAKIIGQTTYGKGSVQDIVPLYGSSALRLTIAEWLTPKDRVINKKGIEPDVAVTGEKTDQSDPVLDKALELAK